MAAGFAAIIPAYQEEKHLGDVVRRTLLQLDRLVVVDDGSSDATAENARSAGAEVIVHPANLGKGESIKTGLRYWLERDAEFVLILDADGQHLPEEIERFTRAAVAHDAKLFVGTRMRDVRTMPPMRRFVNRYMSAKIMRRS